MQEIFQEEDLREGEGNDEIQDVPDTSWMGKALVSPQRKRSKPFEEFKIDPRWVNMPVGRRTRRIFPPGEPRRD